MAAVGLEVGAGAGFDRGVRREGRVGTERRDVSERRAEHADVVEGLQLIRDPRRARVGPVAVQLGELEAERAAGGGGVTSKALVAAREGPGLIADLLRLCAGQEDRVRL